MAFMMHQLVLASFREILKIISLLMCLCLHLYGSLPCMSHTCKGWMKISGLLELELEAAISRLIWVLRENPMEKQNSS